MATIRSVLFVCTGNIFRSMTAEYALRRALGQSSITVASAGTAHRPTLTVRGDVAEYLAGLGLDVSGHRRRTIDAHIAADAGLVIAMHTDHRQHLEDAFGITAPLYSEACTGHARDMPDVDDLFEPKDFLSPAAIEHVRRTIDWIIADAPKLAARLQSDGRF